MRGARIRGKAEFAGTKPRMLLKINGKTKNADILSDKATILLKTIKLPSEMGPKIAVEDLLFKSDTAARRVVNSRRGRKNKSERRAATAGLYA